MLGVRTMLALALVGLTAAASHAAILAESTFDTDDEGWMVSGTSVATPARLFDPTTSDGWIEAFGFQPLIAFEAPTKFLGNQSAAFGGQLDLELRLGFSDGSGTTDPLVILSDGTTSLQFRSTPPTLFEWTPLTVPLVASAGWQLFDGSGNPGPAASDAQLQAVLGNLARLAVNVDWNAPGGPTDGGDDITDLDNVRLISGPAAPVPEPSTLTLALAGAGALVTAARLRRSRR